MPVTTKEFNITLAMEWFTGARTIFADTIYQEDGVTPEDITGWAITYELARSNNLTGVVTKTVGAGIVITDGPAGELEVTIDAADTVDLYGAVGPSYVFEIRRTTSGSEGVATFGSAVLRQSLA